MKINFRKPSCFFKHPGSGGNRRKSPFNRFMISTHLYPKKQFSTTRVIFKPLERQNPHLLVKTQTQKKMKELSVKNNNHQNPRSFHRNKPKSNSNRFSAVQQVPHMYMLHKFDVESQVTEILNDHPQIFRIAMAKEQSKSCFSIDKEGWNHLNTRSRPSFYDA